MGIAYTDAIIAEVNNMKRYIKSNTNYDTYVLDRNGHIWHTALHVPSTTYVNRGLVQLAPTDAQFLYSLGKISENDVKVIVLYDFYIYNNNSFDYGPLDLAKYMSFAELKYAPDVRNILLSAIDDKQLSVNVSKFNELNHKWYSYLCNQFVKVSEFGKTIEFRISSDDGFDWNKVIIDDVLIKNSELYNEFKINIVRESSEGYKAYFLNASLDDILRNDKVVLSSQLLVRKVIDGRLIYTK